MTLQEMVVELEYWMKIAEESEGDRISKDAALQVVALIEAEIHKMKGEENG